MTALKLARLPDTTPQKVQLLVAPQLYADLLLYARLYNEAYGHEAGVADLIPSMLSAFLASDRTFVRRKGSPDAPHV